MTDAGRHAVTLLYTAAAIVTTGCGGGGGGSSTSTTEVSTAATSIERANSGIGLNLGLFDYWSTDVPVIDQFKRSSGWLTQCAVANDTNCTDFAGTANAWNTQEQSQLDLDSGGWVRSLPASGDTTVKYRRVSAYLPIGDATSRPAGHYIVLYDGQGTIEYGLGGTKVASLSITGRDVVAVDNSTTAGILLTITRTVAGDHIRNIRVIPPGGICSTAPSSYVAAASSCSTPNQYISLEQLLPTQTYHPAFLADLRGFRALRFMDWMRANTTTASSWSARPTLGNTPFWTGANGVPIEAQLELSNTIGADAWINLPPYVDDDYVQQFAALAKQRLSSNLGLILEYGNEPWNYAYPYNVAGAWYEQKAKAKWPSSSEGSLQLRMNWYALRSVQVCNIVKQQFADQASRVKCVLNGQAAWTAVSEMALACPLAAVELGKPCGKFVDALAIAPYFGGYVPDTSVRTAVNSWLSQTDGGLTTLFSELTGQDSSGKSITAPLSQLAPAAATPAGGALAQAQGWMVSSKALADKYALPMYAYEGGQHLAAYDSDTGMANLIYAANRDSRMGAAYTRNLSDWKNAGGQVFMALTYAAAAEKSAAWGLKEAQFQTTAAPKWDAVKSFRDSTACWWTNCTSD